MKERKSKKQDPDRIGLGKIAVWTSRDLSKSANLIVISYLTLYCTDILALSPILVGTLLLVSRILDGVTDIIAGYIVDRTNTKIGRGRPYELCIVGLWLCTIFMFSCPQEWSTVAKCIWILAMYAAVNSIFSTLLAAAGTPYMVRAFNNPKIYVKLTSYGGLMQVLAVGAVNIIFPQLMLKYSSTAAGWQRMVLICAIPFTLIGILRFFFIPEKYKDIDAVTEKINLKQVVEVLKTNKYVYMIGMVSLVSNLVASMGVGTYYCLYIYKNIGLASIMSIISFVVMPLMLLLPTLMKRFTKAQIINVGFVLECVSTAIMWFVKDNFTIGIVASLIGGVGSLCLTMLTSLMIIDCAEYNEWKGLPRMEATLSVIPNLASKISSALGAFLLGVFLELGGYISSTSGSTIEQPDSAILMIRLLSSWIPFVFFALGLFCMRFYDLEKKIPQIMEDNASRREEKEQKLPEQELIAGDENHE
jgi:probable glucitol transport protein GutA